MDKIDEALKKLTFSLFKQQDDMVNSFLRDMIELLLIQGKEVSLKNLKLKIILKSNTETEYLLYFKDELMGGRIFKVKFKQVP